MDPDLSLERQVAPFRGYASKADFLAAIIPANINVALVKTGDGLVLTYNRNAAGVIRTLDGGFWKLIDQAPAYDADVGASTYDWSTGDNIGGGPFRYKVLADAAAAWSRILASGKKVDAQPLASGGVNVRQAGADPATADNSAAIQRLLDKGVDVIIPDGTWYAQGLKTTREGQRIYIRDGAKLWGVAGSGKPLLELAAAYSRVEGGNIIAADAAQDALLMSGFQCYSDNVNVTGTSRNACRITGLEAHIIFGKYRGAQISGLSVENADAFLMGPYLEQNLLNGLNTSFGSINAYHVHSFGNGQDGFRMSGSSFSVLMSCYADTNGRHGYYITDSGAGLEMIACWGYKSGARATANPAVPGVYYDFYFVDVRNATLDALRSNGTDGNKAASAYFVGNMHGTTVRGAYAEKAAQLNYTGYLSFRDGKSKMSALDMEPRTNSLPLRVIAPGAYEDYEIALPSVVAPISPAAVGMEILSAYRFIDGSGSDAPSLEIDVGVIGIGITATRNFVKQIFTGPAAYIALSTVVFAVDSLGRNVIQFRVTNTNTTRSLQYAPTVKVLATSRGISAGQ